MNKWKSVLVYGLTVLISVLLIFFGNRLYTDTPFFHELRDAEKPVRAKVLEVLDKRDQSYSIDDENTVEQSEIVFLARVLSGEKKGGTVTANQVHDSYAANGAKAVEVGDKVMLYPADMSIYNANWVLGEYIRSDGVLWLCAIFFVLILLFGRMKGFHTIVSLTFTALSVFLVFVPAVLAGENIYLSSILVCIFIIVMTLLIINGWNRKSFVAAVGCASGVLVAGILAFVMDRVLDLTGVVDETSVYLQFISNGITIDLRAIIFAGIILGAVGAVMDVAMSLASSLLEVYQVSETPSVRGILRSGFNIGRDIMGTMANTLILAYIGSSLSVVLLLVAYNSSMLALFNKEMIVVEILQAVAGSIGILCTIPLTSMAAALTYVPRKKQEEIGE
ncbi:MAG: YibE/F family protein [Ruminococcaceae bacterium]|nr:YibE/F family protein [Oscillospiraceae bacterium]